MSSSSSSDRQLLLPDMEGNHNSSNNTTANRKSKRSSIMFGSNNNNNNIFGGDRSPLRAGLLGATWCFLMASSTIICFSRLNRDYFTRHPVSDTFIAAAGRFGRLGSNNNNNKLCSLPVGDCDGIVNGVSSDASEFFVYDAQLRICERMSPERLSHMCNNRLLLLSSFSFPATEEECWDHCDTSLYVPFGAYLMLFGAMASILQVLSFACLPFDSDKIRLQSSLSRWLLLNLSLIIVEALLSFSGAATVVAFEAVSYGERDWLWSLAVAMQPVLMLLFNLFFWRRAREVYRGIDTSKVVLRGVWSAEM